MGFFEDITLTHSIEIKALPERIFDFLVHLEKNYQTWHPKDHVLFNWLKGNGWEEGSVAYAEEYLHDKLHRLKFLVTKVIPYKEIEYVPVSRLLRIYFPKNTFNVEQHGDTCVFTATSTIRVGWLVRKLAKGKLEHGLESVRTHMREEGENLKQILEKDTV